MATKPRPSEELVNRTLVNGRYIIGEYVTGGKPKTIIYCCFQTHGRVTSIGSYGSFHLGLEVKSNKRVAIKLEKQKMDHPQLHLEFGYYRNLGNVRFIPKVLNFCPIDDWHALVLELLGKCTLYGGMPL